MTKKKGVLWYYGKEPLRNHLIQNAIDYAEHKYGLHVNTVYVHPYTNLDGIDVPGITIKTNAYVLPQHLHLERTEENERT